MHRTIATPTKHPWRNAGNTNEVSIFQIDHTHIIYGCHTYTTDSDFIDMCLHCILGPQSVSYICSCVPIVYMYSYLYVCVLRHVLICLFVCTSTLACMLVILHLCIVLVRNWGKLWQCVEDICNQMYASMALWSFAHIHVHTNTHAWNQYWWNTEATLIHVWFVAGECTLQTMKHRFARKL